LSPFFCAEKIEPLALLVVDEKGRRHSPALNGDRPVNSRPCFFSFTPPRDHRRSRQARADFIEEGIRESAWGAGGRISDLGK